MAKKILLLAILFCLLFITPALAASAMNQGSSGTVPFLDATQGAGDAAATGMAFKMNGTEVMRVTTTGSVGIGTTAPAAKIDIHGTTPDGAGISIRNDTAGGTGGLFVNNSAILSLGQPGTTQYLNVNLANGNVGIGTTSPTVKFVVNTGTDKNIWIRPASDYGQGTAGVAIQSNNDAGSATQPLQFYGNPIILSGGNVGIGTTSPGYKFVVSSGNAFSSDGNCWSMIPFSGYALATSCGNGIGYYSDARLKKNIASITDGLNTIMALRPVSFYWKKESSNHPLVIDKSKRAMSYGFIAQEVLNVLPDLVGELPAIENPSDAKRSKEKGESRYVLSYEGIIAPTVAAVQELKVMLEKLKAENDNLRAQNTAFEARLEKLEARAK